MNRLKQGNYKNDKNIKYPPLLVNISACCFFINYTLA